MSSENCSAGTSQIWRPSPFLTSKENKPLHTTTAKLTLTKAGRDRRSYGEELSQIQKKKRQLQEWMHTVARTMASANVINVGGNFSESERLTVIGTDQAENKVLGVQSQKADGDCKDRTKHGCQDDAVPDGFGVVEVGGDTWRRGSRTDCTTSHADSLGRAKRAQEAVLCPTERVLCEHWVAEKTGQVHIYWTAKRLPLMWRWGPVPNPNPGILSPIPPPQAIMP